MIKVSFIVPIYNTSLYLGKCIDSIIKQDVSKEVILIDDGSTDNSLSIALEYAKKYPFITVVHQANQGQSVARNKGIELAKGEYIQFVDSDDYLLDGIIPNIYGYAVANNADIAHYQAYVERTDTRTIGTRLHKQLEDMDAILQNVESYFNYVVSELGFIPFIPTKLYKREFLLQNNLRFITGITAEDWLFAIQTYTCDKDAIYVEIKEFGYVYVRRENSTDTSYNVKYYLDHLIICNYTRDWLKVNQFSDVTKNNINHLISHLENLAKNTIYPELSENDKLYIKNLEIALNLTKSIF